jgi:DNA-binding transcriptional ArsR family regulator
MSDRLNTTFAALANPPRRAILARLSSGARSVTELASPFDTSRPATSNHLRVLGHSGLITRSRAAPRRPCRLHAAPFKEATDWLTAYRRHREERLDRLDDYLQKLKKKGNQHAHGKE